MPDALRTIQIQMMSPHDAVGGGALHARGIAQGLRRAGVRVTLLCTGDDERPHDPDYDEVVAARPRSWPLLWRWPPLGSLPYWYRATARSTAQVDAVIALSPAMAVAARWVRHRAPVLYCPAVLDKVEHPLAPRSPLKWLERQAFRRSDAVLFTADAVRRAVEALYCRLRIPWDICPLGIDHDHALAVSRTRAQLGIPADARLLVTVGLVNENKGQRYIARALARCAEANWWWAVLGDGPDGPAIRRELRGSPIEQRTLFTGQDPRPADWLAAADLLIASSRHETFGLAIGEALQAGVPVVLPNDQLGRALSPLAEAVTQHQLGRTFDRCDTASLCEAITHVLADQSELTEMGRRAAAYARSAFSWDRYAATALDLLTRARATLSKRASTFKPAASGQSRAREEAVASETGQSTGQPLPHGRDSGLNATP